MTASCIQVTEDDLLRLMCSDAAEERAIEAHKLCRSMDRIPLDREGRAAAIKIINILAADTAELVRRALSVTLRASNLLPVEVARKLAMDIDSIALPVIQSSPVFSDDDLIEIIRAGSVVRQIAVAARPSVSRDVSEVLAVEGSVEALRRLASNDNADFSEWAMGVAVDRFGSDGELVSAMALRQVLPPAIVERLIKLATDTVREHLVTRHAVPAATALRLSDFARERATVDLIDEAMTATDMALFVSRLYGRKALTASLLLRALARGQMTLFEHGVAMLAHVPHHRAWLMVHDAGPLGLRAIYDRAGLPPRLFSAFRAGVDTWRSMQGEGIEVDQETFRHRMLERFLTQMHMIGRDDLDYLMERLDMTPPTGNYSRLPGSGMDGGPLPGGRLSVA